MNGSRLHALGSIVSKHGRLTRYQFYSPALDFYDHWSELDPEVTGLHPQLPPLCEAFAHDINNLAVFASELLRWSSPNEIKRPQGVVAVGAISEAYITTLRSAADIVAGMVAYCIEKKPGQAPRSSLHDLLVWAKKHPQRLDQGAAMLLASDWTWFYQMRTIRDLLVHDGLHATISNSRRAYRLWIYSEKRGWIARTPLFPLLGKWTSDLQIFAADAGTILAKRVSLPKRRVRSRVLEGLFIPHFHRFLSEARKPVATAQTDIYPMFS